MSEWFEATRRSDAGFHVWLEGALLLAVVYITARSSELSGPLRRALNWIGGIAFIPFYLVLAFEGWWDKEHLPMHLSIIGWGALLFWSRWGSPFYCEKETHGPLCRPRSGWWFW